MYACFIFNDTATTEIYTLSLHDALPISLRGFPDPVSGRDEHGPVCVAVAAACGTLGRRAPGVDDPPVHLSVPDRKSTRLNSSHANISYAVFCLKKKI